MTVTPEELILRRRAYWLSLQQGSYGATSQETITVPVPESNVLDVNALQELMELSRKGGI